MKKARPILGMHSLAAQKVLVLSKGPENLELAKGYATSRFLSSDLRTKLLGVIAEQSSDDLVDWLLKQEDFKDSARDKLVRVLVDYLMDLHEYDRLAKLLGEI